MRLTNNEANAFCEGNVKLEDVVLDNARGMAAADLYAIVTDKVQALKMRSKALEKEYRKLIDDHAKKDRKGNKEYANPTEPDPNKRVLLWRDPEKWQAAYEAWQKKVDELGSQVIEFEATPLPDDFFTKPDELTVVQAIRTAFRPVMQAHQDAMAKAHPPAKRKK